MPQIKIGIQLTSLRQPFKKALHTAARLGARAVEIDARGEIRPEQVSQTGIRQIRKMLEDLDLRVCAVGFRTRRGYNVAEDLDARVAATKRAMKLAYDLGAGLVINQVGRIPSPDDKESWNMLLGALSDLGRHGQHVGALLAAETGSEDSADLARLLEAVMPEGSIGVNFDPGNLIINGFSPREAITNLGSRVLHVHAKDAVRDLAQGRGVEVPLGRGSADFPELVGALEEFEYRGYFTVERENARDPVGEIGLAVQFLQNL